MVILIVEDEPSIREVEVAYLTQAGYETLEAADGQAAVDLFAANKPDLAIVDLNLPGMSGLDVCRTIRHTSTIPILIVTARTSDDDEVRGFEVGADDYLKKPFNPNVLVVRVQALLRRQTTKRLTFADLHITPSTMSVIKDGKPIELTTVQFNLLLALASRPNVVFSRTQLVDTIYSNPGDHFIYDRTIDAHIKALRKRIEADPHNPRYIQTVIGAGYRFRGDA
jgi:DNA-binding response OmpR family regulator